MIEHAMAGNGIEHAMAGNGMMGQGYDGSTGCRIHEMMEP